jgi:hypothetical protein
MRSRRNTAILAGLIVLLLIFTAFRSGEPSGGVASPYEISNRVGAAPNDVLVVDVPAGLFGCNKLCPPSGMFWGSSSSAVLIHDEPGHSISPTIEYSWDLVGEYSGRWYEIKSGSGSDGGPQPGVPRLLSFISQPVFQSDLTFRYGIRPGYVMMVGKPLSPDVRRIEVRFDTGEIVQQPTIVSQSGATSPFALFAKAKVVCQVRLYGSDNALLLQLDTSNDLQLGANLQHFAPDACQDLQND